MVQNNTVNNKNIFGLFPEYNLELASSAKKQEINTTTKPIADDSVEINGEKKKSKKGKIIFGSTLATTIIGAGIAGLLFIKGGHKGSARKLSALGEKLGRDIQEANKLQTKDLMTRCTIVCKKGIKKTLDFLQATSNTNAIKDGAVDSALRSNKITRPFADKSKTFFQKIVNKTLGKKYRKVQVDVDDLTSMLKHYKIDDLRHLDDAQKLQQVTIKGVTKTLGEWTDDLARYTKDLGIAFDDGFSKDAIIGRNKKRSKLLSGLSEKVKTRFFKNKGLFKPENYKTYATEEIAKPAQDELRDSIIASRKRVTNNIQTIHDSIKTNLSSFSEQVKPDDEIAISTIRKLGKKMEEFRVCSGAEEVTKRAQISDEIAGIIDEAIAGISKNQKYGDTEQLALIQQLLNIKGSVISTKGNSKGAIENISSILKGLNEAQLGATGKKIVSDAELKQYGKLSSKIRDGLTKATELEAGEYFLKQAELEVGSAANDVLSIALPVGVGAYSIAKGDDKDERISAVLTTCIPLVGTFATFVYGTAKMFSGAKNLIFSAVSGIALGKLGNYCDKLYKEYRNSGSVVKVAKDEYDKFWTDITPKYAEPLTEIEETKKTEEKENKK